MGKDVSSTPKYAIRVALVWLVPLIGILIGSGYIFCMILSLGMTFVEVPELRRKVFGARAKRKLPCLRVPLLLRVAALWMLQVWVIIIGRATSSAGGGDDAMTDDPVAGLSGATKIDGEARGRPYGAEGSLAWTPQTLSVVLPCAGESQFALNTVRAVYDSTPSEALAEIIVVDDGSEPPLGNTVLTQSVRRQYRVRIIRHEATVGLIGAKKDGGDAAVGDIIVFFDCHVAPQEGWHSHFLRSMAVNYRRIVVPQITDLDIDRWQQRRGGNGNAKCYLTWDADFKWFESADDASVPVLSGGLLGISQRWWNETGGYDTEMKGWGGENLDQSLRSWLCGGEIMALRSAQVAHMWRTPNDPRTMARYTVPPGASQKNRVRAAAAWFGPFAEKLSAFPSLAQVHKAGSGDLRTFKEVQKRLKCKSFAWFLHRFKHVYVDGGLLPQETFLLRTKMDRCLTYLGGAGTSPTGQGQVGLQPCNKENDRQRWHMANRDAGAAAMPCCSGLRGWNTDQCLTASSGQALATTVCDISGRHPGQQWQLTEDGQLKQAGGFLGGSCLVPSEGSAGVAAASCTGVETWEKHATAEPLESRLYREAGEREGWGAP